MFSYKQERKKERNKERENERKRERKICTMIRRSLQEFTNIRRERH